MTQYGMIINLERCIGCHTCAVSCRSEWHVPTEYRRSWVKRLGPSNTPDGLSFTFYPGMCNHCDTPACVAVCPVDPVEVTFKDAGAVRIRTIKVAATWKDPFDGAVRIDTSDNPIDQTAEAIRRHVEAVR